MMETKLAESLRIILDMMDRLHPYGVSKERINARKLLNEYDNAKRGQTGTETKVS